MEGKAGVLGYGIMCPSTTAMFGTHVYIMLTVSFPRELAGLSTELQAVKFPAGLHLTPLTTYTHAIISHLNCCWQEMKINLT